MNFVKYVLTYALHCVIIKTCFKGKKQTDARDILS